jgi:hypothetical protein
MTSWPESRSARDDLGAAVVAVETGFGDYHPDRRIRLGGLLGQRVHLRVKSVIAGEHTAPPAAGPMISDICGITPEARV